MDDEPSSEDEPPVPREGGRESRASPPGVPPSIVEATDMRVDSIPGGEAIDMPRPAGASGTASEPRKLEVNF